MQPEPRRYTPEEYFDLDEAAPEGVRLEYFDGNIYHKGQIYDPSNPELARAMAGGTFEHGRMSTNTAASLVRQIPDCHVVAADQQVRMPDGSYVYPDVVASCDPERSGHQLLTPHLIVEVLSTGTAETDLGTKLGLYLEIDSLLEYWVAAQDAVRVIRYYRSDAGWIIRIYTTLDATIVSDGLGIELPLRELYRGVVA